MAVPVGAWVALASGVPLLLLGAGLAAVRPRRPDQTFFAGFAILWGVIVVAANFGGPVLADASLHATLLLFSLSLMPVAALFLTHFAVGVARRPRLRALSWMMAAWAAVTVAWIIARPRWFVDDVVAVEAGIHTTWGPLTIPLVFVPFYGAFYLTLVVLYVAYRGRVVGSTRHHDRGLLLALALFTSYNTVKLLFVYLDPPATVAVLGPASTAVPAGLFAVGALVLAGLVGHLVTRPPPPESVDLPLVLAFVVPALFALFEAGLARWEVLILDSVGFWRLATVAVLVYALARRHLFDLDLRLKRIAGIAAASLFLAYGAVTALVLRADGYDLFRTGTPALLGIALAGVSLAARDRLADRLFPGVAQEDDYLHQRKLEVYRGLLEAAYVATGTLDSDPLRAARRRLAIDDREHRIMEFMVQKAKVAPLPTETAPEEVRVAPGALLKGRYRIDRLLGEGAHGRAHLAHDEQEDRQVVVKAVGTSLLGGRAAQLLLKEARLLSRLDHPNVVRILDALEGTHETVIVMEFADGGNLYGLLNRRGKLPFEDGVRLLDEMLAALATVHGKGIVHRDLKPENILLRRDGTAKLADFGVAREARADATGLTAGAVGTLLYMSPEQVRGRHVDARSDLYAAAVVFHQAVTGRFYLPIAGKDDFQVRRLILEGAPRLETKGLPAWVGPFLWKAMAKDPDDRFPDATAMRKALADALPRPLSEGQADGLGRPVAS